MNQLVKLEDVCVPYFSNLAQKDLINLDGKFPVFGASGFIKNINTYQRKKDYIAIIKDGASIGKSYLLPKESSIIGTMQAIEPKDNIDIQYLFYLIQYLHLERYYSGSTIPHIYFKDYKKEKFFLPELSIQKQRARCLKLIDNIIIRKKEIIKSSDDLIKSQFIEMFGKNNYPICRLKDECEIITKGTTPTTIGYNFTDTGVNFIKIENIDFDGHFDTSKLMYISEECNLAMKRSQLKTGDILFSIAGAIGRCAIVPEKLLPANINQALAIIRIKQSSKLTNGFLFAAVQSGYISNQYLEKKRGVAQLNLSLKDIGEFTIPIPPVNQQLDFISIAEQADKSKFDEKMNQIAKQEDVCVPYFQISSKRFNNFRRIISVFGVSEIIKILILINGTKVILLS